MPISKKADINCGLAQVENMLAQRTSHQEIKMTSSDDGMQTSRYSRVNTESPLYGLGVVPTLTPSITNNDSLGNKNLKLPVAGIEMTPIPRVNTMQTNDQCFNTMTWPDLQENDHVPALSTIHASTSNRSSTPSNINTVGDAL